MENRKVLYPQPTSTTIKNFIELTPPPSYFFPQAPKQEAPLQKIDFPPNRLHPLMREDMAEVIAAIKDKNTKNMDDAANNLRITKTALTTFLNQYMTTYAQIKLEDLTDAELIAAFGTNIPMAEVAKKLGVGRTQFNNYLSNERQNVRNTVFSQNSLRP